MIEVELTKEMFDRAHEKAQEMGNLKNSIRNGEGNTAGFLGEEIVLATFKTFKRRNTYDSDLYYKNVNFEVKTKQVTSVPLPHFNCTVANYNTRQKAHCYIFCRVWIESGVGWILGYMTKKDFKNKRFWGAEGDPDGENFKFKANCYNVRVSDLQNPENLFCLNHSVS